MLEKFEPWYDSLEEPNRLMVAICIILPFMISFSISVNFMVPSLFILSLLYLEIIIRLKPNAYKKVKIPLNIVTLITVIIFIIVLVS